MSRDFGGDYLNELWLDGISLKWAAYMSQDSGHISNTRMCMIGCVINVYCYLKKMSLNVLFF